METIGSKEVDSIMVEMNIVEGMENERKEWNETFKMSIEALCSISKIRGEADEVLKGTNTEGEKKVNTIVYRKVWDLTASCFTVLVLTFFFYLSDSESIWSEWHSDWPVFQDVWPTHTEADRGMEPVLPHQFQSKGGRVSGQIWGHGLGRWLSGLCGGSCRSVLRI